MAGDANWTGPRFWAGSGRGSRTRTTTSTRTMEARGLKRHRERERRLGRLGKLVLADGRFIPVEAVDQAGEHRYDPREHFFAGASAVSRDQRSGDRRVKAGGALKSRATGVVKKFGAVAAVTFTVSLGRVEKHGKACTVKLVNQLASMLPLRSGDIRQKVADPSGKMELDTINVEFFVIKEGFIKL